MDKDVAIKVSGVYKNFKLPHQKTNSLKSIFTGLFKGKSKGFEVQHALADISFEVKKGEFFGIVGRNGSGKSTLLKILAEIYQPTRGHVSKDGRLVPFIELGVGFNPELTGRENVYLNGALLGFSTDEIDEQYDDIVQFAELEQFMDQKLKNYSSGMQVRLAFSVATRAKAEILLIDEVLAVGDADFQRKCFEYFKSLKKNKVTVVFVSHDMAAVREFCDRAVLVEKSKLIDIGQTDAIAQKYSELFIQDVHEDQREDQDAERWGNGDAMIGDVEVTQSEDSITVRQRINVKKDVDTIIYGLHIIASDGKEVTAMNNVMIKQPSIKNASNGDVYEIVWQVMNIFNDGKYTIDLTLVDSMGNTLDWCVSAGRFIVKRAERSTTPVFPPLEVEVHTIK